MSDKIFENLNDKQIEAVKVVDGPVLVISGPGSGKTRCLTHRVDYLMSQGIQPENILAVTFTNKAAGEMRERVEKLLAPTTDKKQLTINQKSNVYSQMSNVPRIGTFHSIGLSILRQEIPQLGYRRSFNIFDEDDQLSLVKRVMGDLEIDTKSFNPKVILYKISELKTNLIFPEDHPPAGGPKEFFAEIVAKIYRKYQQELKSLNAVDFDDLIVLPVKIFKQNPETLQKYQELWRYVLVDEYQDTSCDQYMFINLLAQKYRNLFCIGDDAQSIYQFRRADIRNILNFQKNYPEAKIILLEQNYRSSKNIITAAQGIISNNKNQIPKELWTENNHGEKIVIAEAMNERHEASIVISKIEELTKKKYTGKDFAVLYRTHAQSRAVEEALIMSGYPYQIIGGLKFYERKEIKDILAYLKLIINPTDSLALERIYNIPARGIGKALIEKVRTREEPVITKALADILLEKTLPARQLDALKDFHALLTYLTKISETKNLPQTIRSIIKKTDYEEYLKEYNLSKTHDNENLEERIENLKELFTVASKYEDLDGKEGAEKFLEEIALLQNTDKMRTDPNRITLMTTHSSKGLEFPVVFVVGLEEGLFPHSRTLINPIELEEERRLCYVAITRAKEHLILTYTKFRNIYGSNSMNLPSRFINEIPQHLVDYQLINMGFDDNNDGEETIRY